MVASGTETRRTLTQQVAEGIRERIRSGELGPGDAVPSERELSRVMEVSRVTARNALLRLVEEGLLRREAGRGYFVKSESETAVNGRSGGALVFVHGKSEEEIAPGSTHAAMYAGAREEAARAGATVLVNPVREAVITPRKAEELRAVAGGVICDQTGAESVRALLEAGVPTVQIHYYREGVPVDTVVQDDVGGITQAVEYLAAHGHRAIGYLDTSEALRAAGIGANSEMRRAGYEMARRRFGLDARDELIGRVDPGAGRLGEVLAGVLAAGATAVISAHRGVWIEARDEFAARGGKLPTSFGVVIWCSQPEEDDVRELPTYVTWDREQMGREAVRRLLLRLERPDLEPAQVVIPTRLVDCGTGGRGPSG
jgi:LacI family transcriptional regulator